MRLAAPDEPSSVGDILVVDDRPENLVAIEAALSGLSLRLVTARSGAEALRYLLYHDVALILLDVQMPTMSGLETASLIRSRDRTRHVPIIFITAHDRSDALVLEAYRLGAVDFLFEPITADVLRAKASVFVELQRRTAEVAKQAALIREQERVAREQALADQRRRLEAEALRERLAEEKRHAEILLEKNGQLQRAYAELQRVNQHLEADDRRKNEFIAVLAHELRNPLVPITAGLDILADSAGEPETLDRVQPAMRRQVEHLVRLVDDLLDVSRITSGKIELRREPVKTTDFLTRAVEMSRPVVDGRNHALVLDIDTGVDAVHVDGDPVRLAQVVSNLLNNAARYTDPGGRIELQCGCDGEGVLVRVIDDGAGMEPDLIDRVFDMFVQGQADGSGLGIGLTLVARMVELHGGTVTAHSEGPGKGSRFEVRLPVFRGEVQPSVAPPPEPQVRPLRIAIVEDNEDVREMMRFLLERWGHEVVGEAGTATSGIELLLKTRPDVALIDLGLPDLPGYDVARRVCSALGASRPRLVAFSGFSQADDRRASAEAGFDEHLSKPVRDAQLRRALLTS
jgi:two-component system, sensor histidine kinase